MLSILIVNWNTRDLLSACLSSIKRCSGPIDVETIVVDNASTDGSADRVRATFPDVRLIEPQSNTGYARGNNLAIQAASGRWLLTLNPDTELYDDTLQQALEAMERHPHAGALGARQIGLNGATQRSVRGFPTLLGIVGDITGLGKLFPKTVLGSYRLSRFDYELEQDAPQPMGTFLLFRREALEALVPDLTKTGPYDESFPIFFNEVDLLYRLRKAGWSTVYAPTVRILHHGGEGTRQRRKDMIWESHRSLMRFFQKHHPSAALPLLKMVVYLGALIRAKGVYAGFRP